MPRLLLGPGASRLLSIHHAARSRSVRRTPYNFESRSRVSGRRVRCQESSSSSTPRVTSLQNDKSKRHDREGWILDNPKAIRSAPLFFGGASLVAVLLNRSFSSIAAVADASSAQSGAGVLAVALSAIVVLTGLVWKSIEPKPQFPVELDVVECDRVASGLPVEAARELNWDLCVKQSVLLTLAVIIQLVGNDGIMILGSDTLRGFGPSDQGWIVAIGEKLDSTLADTMSSWDRDFVPGRESTEKPIGTTRSP